jgi:beta-galactosidase
MLHIMITPKLGISKQSKLFYGADYNPDQWQHTPEILERDIELMKQAGVTTASVGIFAWTALEPEEGRTSFEWLDRVMDRFSEEGMFLFLATPSGSKPMWLSEKYPEVRRVNKAGIRDASGGRHNHCMSSSIYRQKTAQMNRALAERYQNHPALALWHVGNEFSGECHCDLCRVGFQAWLKAKYRTLDAMNEAWWANFWNHTFTDWSQVPTFDESIDGLSLDWLRFTNDLHVSFFRNEMEPLRELTPDVPCTTNFMGTHEGTNYWQWSEHLDVISNDLYPMPDDREHTWQQSIASDFIHSMMRGMSGGKTWMLLECSPSSVNWGQINKLKRPGVHRQEVLQAVANGADTIHYFQWRKGRGGFEKYHGAVVDHEGSDQGRVYQECAAVGRELDSLESLCQQDLPQADIAIVYDWESRWALNASCGPKKAEAVHPYPSGHLYRGLPSALPCVDGGWAVGGCAIGAV